MYQLMDNIIMVTPIVDLLNSKSLLMNLSTIKVNTLTLYILVSSADYLCKQFGSRSSVLTKSTSIWFIRSNVVFCLI